MSAPEDFHTADSTVTPSPRSRCFAVATLPPVVFTLGLSGLAVLVAFLVAGLLLWGYGINPWRF